MYKTRLCRAPFPVLLLLLLLRTLSPLSLEVLNVAEDELLEPARRLLTKVRQVEGRLGSKVNVEAEALLGRPGEDTAGLVL